MSDKIPFEIKVEIMKRLPVKSLIQFRSVSKAWKSLIDSSDFIARYTALNSEPQHLLVSEDNLNYEYKFALIADDDDNFPQQRVNFTIPQLVNWLTYFRIIGCSHGVVFLFGDRKQGRGDHRSVTVMVILWNPSIRKAVGVIVPNFRTEMYRTVVGFGVCGETMDPKIVKITYIIDNKDIDVESVSCIPSQVEVFTLSTGVWRSPYRNLPRKSIRFGYGPHVVVDGFLYWLANEKVTRDGGYNNNMSYSLIVSFDITTEEFGEVSLPDSLALAVHTTKHILEINKLRNSLVVIDRYQDANNPAMDIWMRIDGVFMKLFNLKVNAQRSLVMGFRKNGAPIVETQEEGRVNRELVVYEPNSKNMDSLWIHGIIPSIVTMYPYMESLLLLDQPDLMVYNDISM